MQEKSRNSCRIHRLVIELSSHEEKAWEGLLNNVENARHALGENNTVVEIVAHGEGLKFLAKENQAMFQRMRSLSRTQVTFAACQNTMKRTGVTKEDLFEFALPVDSGVGEVIRKQESEWAYIKAG